MDQARLEAALRALPHSFNQLQKALARAKLSDIYDFLNSSQSSGNRGVNYDTTDDVEALIWRARKLGEAYRDYPEAANIASLVVSFLEEGHKESYDTYLLQNTRFSLCKEIDTIMEYEDELNDSKFDKLTAKFTRQYFPQQKVQALIIDYCEHKRYPVSKWPDRPFQLQQHSTRQAPIYQSVAPEMIDHRVPKDTSVTDASYYSHNQTDLPAQQGSKKRKLMLTAVLAILSVAIAWIAFTLASSLLSNDHESRDMAIVSDISIDVDDHDNYFGSDGNDLNVGSEVLDYDPEMTEIASSVTDTEDERGISEDAGAHANPGVEPRQPQIRAGNDTSFAIMTDGSLWAWGLNGAGQIGDGTTTDRHSPVRIMDDVIDICTGIGFAGTRALKSDGSLWAWGSNSHGSVGDGTAFDQYTPVKILDDVIALSGNLAIRADSSLWSWGWNGSGQVGDGTTIDRHSPVRIMDGVATIASNGQYSMAIRTDGSLWVWGLNRSGNLGIGTFDNQPTPTKIMDDVASILIADLGYTLDTGAIKTDGSLWIWGGVQIQQDDGSQAHLIVPRQILDDVVYLPRRSGHGMAIRSDGGLWTWGGDFYSQFMSDVLTASNGGRHSAAIRNDGSLWTWGNNGAGQLGRGSATELGESDPADWIPAQILNNVIDISIGNFYTLAVTSDGNVWAWGSNAVGQLGDGTTTSRYSPVRVLLP